MRLMCGHCISRDALTKLTSGHKLKCPYCPVEQNPSDAKIIQFWKTYRIFTFKSCLSFKLWSAFMWVRDDTVSLMTIFMSWAKTSCWLDSNSLNFNTSDHSPQPSIKKVSNLRSPISKMLLWMFVTICDAAFNQIIRIFDLINVVSIFSSCFGLLTGTSAVLPSQYVLCHYPSAL